MADKYIKMAEIVQKEFITPEIVNIWIQDKEMANAARAGQFASIYCKDGSRLLPRPISICEIDKRAGRLRFVYRIAGEGTKELSLLEKGDTLKIMGPLGNGFALEGGRALVIGGGIGIPPMLELSKELDCEKQIVLGYRDALFLKEEFEPYGSVYVATEDGSFGTRGNVLDAIREHALEADIIFACGPLPMLKGIKAFAAGRGIKAQISMEEHMACGIGACLACVCGSKETDEHTNVKNKRICKDGPVFYAEEIDLEGGRA